MQVVDCERVVGGMLGQPVNTVTALAFVVAGVVVAVRSRRAWLATALVATGVGSVLSHGPMPPGATWAHDVTLAWLLVVVGADGTRWASWSTWPALLVLGALFALLPVVAVPVSVVLAAVAIGAVLWRGRSRRTLVALGLLGAGAVVGRLSATGGAWCDPQGLLQGHGVWHLCAATAVALWALRPDGTVTADRTGSR